jgi:hypothetical protein
MRPKEIEELILADVALWSYPKRWIVECTLARISQHRRMRAFERYPRSVAVFNRLAIMRSCCDP